MFKLNDKIKKIKINKSFILICYVFLSALAIYGITTLVSFRLSKLNKPVTIITQENTQAAFFKKIVNADDYGAKANDGLDDTGSIQKAIDHISSVGGGTVNVNSGVYSINPDISINMKSDTRLNLSSDTTLKSIASANTNYEIINIENVNNVSIVGGGIIGERHIHSGTRGEWGMGINISGSSNVNISSIDLMDCWGDGIYIGGNLSSSVNIDHVVSSNNRRQGISVTNIKSLSISNSEFKNTNGTLPQSGIDIEPNINESVQNVKITNVKSNGNKGSGIDIMGANGLISNINIENSVMKNNAGIGVRIEKASNLKFDNDIVQNSTFGAEITRDVSNAEFNNVNISNNNYRGVSIVSTNQDKGIDGVIFKDSTFANNSQSDTGKSDGVRIDTYDSTGYIKNIKFMNVKFIDDQIKHTQGFGLTVGNSKKISGISVYRDCVFFGNLSGDLYAAIPISQNVPR